MTDFMKKFAEKIKLPTEAVEYFEKVSANIDFTDFNIARDSFMNNGDEKFYNDELKKISEKYNVHIYTTHFLFLMYSAESLFEPFVKKHNEEMFWDLMMDLNYKLYECKKVHNIWGTFVLFWFTFHFNLKLISLGRLQYEERPYAFEPVVVDGVTVDNSVNAYHVHIPGCGPLTREKIDESYKLAISYLKEEDKPLILYTVSWLIFPDFEEPFKDCKNIMDFRSDYTIVGKVMDKNGFNDGWRIFNTDYTGFNINDLPKETRMQRNFAEYLENGGKTGEGIGIIIFK